jgi:hypothetical protein
MLSARMYIARRYRRGRASPSQKINTRIECAGGGEVAKEWPNDGNGNRDHTSGAMIRVSPAMVKQ